MPRDLRTDPNKEVAPLLATCLTLLYGVIGSAFAITMYSRNPGRHAGIVIGVVVGVFVLAWLLSRGGSDAIEVARVWLFRKEKEDPLSGYDARPKGKRARRYGTQRPPTAEEVRQEQSVRSMWVPAQDRNR